MKDSNLQTLMNSGHDYMECSNKGTCDRAAGQCTCLDGFEGVACQRAACPNSCSGHGVCKSIEDLANSDNNNIYKLWDRKSTMGCDCDAGYGGPDCSLTLCKQDIDPLYYDDTATVKYSIFNFATLATCASGGVNTYCQNVASPASSYFNDGTSPGNVGYWAIRFYDVDGEDWLTPPIPAGAECKVVVAALESLPNNVIPKGQTKCTSGSSTSTTTPGIVFSPTVYEPDFPQTSAHPRVVKFKAAFWDSLFPAVTFAAAATAAEGAGGLPSSYDPGTNDLFLAGYVYRIKFFGNPGALKQPQIEIYLDGHYPTLARPDGRVITHVWTDGQQGESYDYFPNHCDGVSVTITKVPGSPTTDLTYSMLSGMTDAEKALLKTCLGGSDDDDTNNVDVYNWDWGNYVFPHLIKLVRSTTTATDGGYYAALIYNGDTSKNFILLNPFESLDSDGSSGGAGTDVYDVYTTTGTLALTTSQVKSFTVNGIASGTGVTTSTSLAPVSTEAIFGYASNEIIMTVPTALGPVTTPETPIRSGSVACEVAPLAANPLPYCLNKTDMFTLLHAPASTSTAAYTSTWLIGNNPPNINLYTVEKIYSKRPEWKNTDLNSDTHGASTGTIGLNVIKTDLSTNWASSLTGKATSGVSHSPFNIYKFVPKDESTYEYVAECSNRGLCDYTQGVCQCFHGYNGDACQQQNSLAV